MVNPAIEEKAAPGRRQHRHRTLRLATPLAGRLEGETVHEVNLVGGGDEPCGVRNSRVSGFGSGARLGACGRGAV